MSLQLAMSSDFWASYISGALGILIGNRLDVLKVQAQAGQNHLGGLPITTYEQTGTASQRLKRWTQLFRGAAAPILGYGALNSILFITFNRSLKWMEPGIFDYTKLAGVPLGKIWIAGALGGLATWVISTPSELVKCRAQLVVDGQGSSYGVLKDIWKRYGIRGLYAGGAVTAVRDSVGYGWYFWSYELSKRLLLSRTHDPFVEPKSWEVLVAGGIAGVVTWVSIYPLDVVKTRLQTSSVTEEGRPLIDGRSQTSKSSMDVAKTLWRETGFKGFYRGVGICSLRAFVVNAVQWWSYERLMALFR